MWIFWVPVTVFLTASVVGSHVVARRTIALSMSHMPADGGARRRSADRMRRKALDYVRFPAVAAPLLALFGELTRDYGPLPCRGDLLVWAVAMPLLASLSLLPALLNAEARLQVSGWSRGPAAGMWASGMLSSGGFAASAGGICAIVARDWEGWHSHATWAAPAAFLAGWLAGRLVQQWLFIVTARTEPFDAQIAGEAARAAGDGPAVRFELWHTVRGVSNQFEMAVRLRSRFLVSEELAAMLRRDEMVAILLCGSGHVRMRHERNLDIAVFASVCVVPLGLAIAGVVSPGWMTILSIPVARLASLALQRRQELAADAFAASRGYAEPLGRAIVAMARAELDPGEERFALSHPALRDRLVRLGLDADALTRGDGPAAESGAGVAASPPPG